MPTRTMNNGRRDVVRRGGGDSTSAIALSRSRMDTAEERGEAFGRTLMIADNLGTNNIKNILRLWLTDDRWREFDYHPQVGDVVPIRLLPGEFDYFLSMIGWDVQFVEDSRDNEVRADAYARIASEVGENRRSVEEVAEAIPHFRDSIQAMAPPQGMRPILKDPEKLAAYRAGASRSSLSSKRKREAFRVDVYSGSDVAALVEKLLDELGARGGAAYDELVGQLLEREKWNGMQAQRDEHIRRLRQAGVPVAEVAKRVGVSQALVKDVTRAKK